MKDILNSAKCTRMKTNTFTGEPQRKWLEYADGVFEPVRKEGSLGKKYHGNLRTLDWWTVDKPAGWNPLDEGKYVSLNHDYGRKPELVKKKAGQVRQPASSKSGAKTTWLREPPLFMQMRFGARRQERRRRELLQRMNR